MLASKQDKLRGGLKPHQRLTIVIPNKTGTRMKEVVATATALFDATPRSGIDNGNTTLRNKQEQT